jgi:hypothetical protein
MTAPAFTTAQGLDFTLRCQANASLSPFKHPLAGNPLPAVDPGDGPHLLGAAAGGFAQ